MKIRPLFVLVLTLALTLIILIVLVFRLCGRLLIVLLPHHEAQRALLRHIEDILALALRHSSWQHTRAFDPRQSRVKNLDKIWIILSFFGVF